MATDEFRERVRNKAERAVADALDRDGSGGDGGGAAAAQEEGGGSASGEAGRAFIERMRANDNAVMQNPFGEPVIEIVAPVELKARVETLLAEWDLNPRGHGVIAQAPSFAEEHPDAAADLVAWQFLLNDGEEDDLESCGWDIPTILSELAGEPILCTKANRVTASIPVE